MSASAERPAPVPISLAGRLVLVARVWFVAAQVWLALRRHPLDEVTAQLSEPQQRTRVPVSLLSRGVSRGLRIGRWQPRCLVRSLVLYRLLRAQGDEADLVIGLPDLAESPDAHAWIELGGSDVGPAPGQGPHREMTRYPHRRG